jgi:hypothetical protein
MTPEQREKGVDPFDTVQRALVYIEGNLVNEAVGLLKQLLTTLDRRTTVTVEIEGPVPAPLPYPQDLTVDTLMDLQAKVNEMNRALGLMANDVKFIRAQQPYKP